jgi:hypothetical protein
VARFRPIQLALLPLALGPWNRAWGQQTQNNVLAMARVTTSLAMEFANVPGSASLSWGDVVPSREASGSVSLDPQTGQRVAQGGAKLPPTSTLPQHPARILIHGTPHTHIVITLSSTSGQMEAPGGRQIGYSGLSCSVSGGAPVSAEAMVPGNLSGNGLLSFQIGGTVLVGANQRPGNYSGSFDTTVSYN